MSEPIDLDDIEARAEAATPGPWNWEVHLNDTEIDFAPGEQAFYWTWEVGGENAELGGAEFEDPAPNVAFIAHARTDVPALIARVRELEADRELAAGIDPGNITDPETLVRLGAQEAMGVARSEIVALIARVRELEAANERLRNLAAALVTEGAL